MCMKIKHIFSFYYTRSGAFNTNDPSFLEVLSYLSLKLHFPGFPPINVAISQSLLLGLSLIPDPSMLEYPELFWTLCFSVLHICPKKCHPLLTLITT